MTTTATRPTDAAAISSGRTSSDFGSLTPAVSPCPAAGDLVAPRSARSCPAVLDQTPERGWTRWNRSLSWRRVAASASRHALDGFPSGSLATTHCCQLAQWGCHVCGSKPLCGSCAASRALPLAQFSIRKAPPSAVGSRSHRCERSRLRGRRSTTGPQSSAPSTASARPADRDVIRTVLLSLALSISHCCHGSACVSHTTGREPSSADCPASSALPHCRHRRRHGPPKSVLRLRRTRRRSVSSSSTFNTPTFTVTRAMAKLWTRQYPDAHAR